MKKSLLLVAFATIFAFSCQQEIEPETNPAKDLFTLSASIEDLTTPTKANMDDDGFLVWKDGDQIGVYVSGWGDDSNQQFDLFAGIGSYEADFVRHNEEGWFYTQDAQAAFFPWQGQGSDKNNVVDGETMYFKLPSYYVDYTSAKMLTPLVAPLVFTGNVEAGKYTYAPIAFKHAGAAVKVTINNLPAGAHSIGMTADQQIWGEYHVSVDDAGTAVMVLDEGKDYADNNTIWLNYANDEENPFTFIFPTPAMTTPKLSFIIYDENGLVVWSRKLKAQTVSPGRGEVLVMPALDITPYEQFYNVSENWVVQGNLTGDNAWTDINVVTDGTTCIAKGLSFPANGEFKIKHPGESWDGSWPENNYKIENAEPGVYDIIFKDSTGDFDATDFKLVASKCPYPTATQAVTEHHTSIRTAVDLGANETANCYVITAPGAYKIPCVKGNRKDVSAGTRASVKLLWETYNNNEEVTKNSVISAVDWDVNDNYVYFKTPETLKPGNALIAALDANGDIIWSWHIWIPDTAIESSTYGKIYNHELMDRNLGALVAATTTSVPVESYGLQYQWGRKDPFVGAKRTDSSSQALVSGTSMTVASDHMTVAETIANPTVFAIYSSTDTWGPWLNPASDTPSLWVDASKTEYDPCPAGYRVPAYDSTQPLHASDLSTVNGWSINSDGRYFTLGDPATVFPFGGYIQENGKLGYNGTRSFIWMAHANNENYGYILNVRTDGTHERSSTVSSRACTVRCVKIEEAPVFDKAERASAVDKSADESANCYVVSAAESSNASKIFKFKTVKGNSEESLEDAASAVVLWETWNNALAVKAKSVVDAVEYYDGYVYFRMPATLHAGNALIAVKDSEGTILWSWHIWVPSTTITSSTYGISLSEMMDRNLGALETAEGDADTDIAVESCGLFYQWGRKDPFPGPKDLPNSYTSSATISGSIGTRDMTSSTEIHKYPNDFVETGTETEQTKDWSTDHLSTLWGSSKTVNDPCPPGWKLPIFESKTGDIWDSSVTDKTSLAGYALSTTHHWLKLGVEYDGTKPKETGYVYFPLAGYLTQDAGDYANAGKRALIWQAYGENSVYAKCLYSDGGFVGYRNDRKGRGGNVRCIQIPVVL